MNQVRRGFSLASDSLTLAFLPGENELRIQCTIVNGDDVVHEWVRLDVPAIEDFMRDMRRVTKSAGAGGSLTVAEAPTLPGLGEDESATPAQVADAVAVVKAAGQRRRSTP